MAAAFKTDFTAVSSGQLFLMTACRELATCSCSGCHVHVRSCYYQLRCLIRRSVSTNVFLTIVHGFVCSCTNYCNPLYLGSPKARLSPVQSILNAAARMIAVCNLTPTYLTTPLFCLGLSH